MKTVVGLGNSAFLAKSAAKKAGARFVAFSARRFPDGEPYLRFAGKLGKEVCLIQSLSPKPDNALIELVFAARTARELGARKVNAIIPYLAYMRQDTRFKEGECISALQMAFLLNSSLDSVVTVDPHLHRIRSLREIFKIPTKRVTATDAIAQHIKREFRSSNTLIVGPDIESYQWAHRIADSIGFKATIFLKKRFSSRRVKINVTKELEWRGRNVVIVDDIISSGCTMIETVRELKKRRPKALHCICVHGIFAEGAYEKLFKAGAKSVASCNTIPHRSNRIDLSGMLAGEI